MILTFVVVLVLVLFVVRPLQKNAFFMLYFALMVGTAFVLEKYGYRFAPFSKQSFVMFLPPHFVWINFVTLLAYMADKRAAQKGDWRVSEMNLHLLELLGGSPAAFVSQKIFHHKTKKKSFQMFFLFVLAVQITIVYYACQILKII